MLHLENVYEQRHLAINYFYQPIRNTPQNTNSIANGKQLSIKKMKNKRKTHHPLLK